MVEFEKKDNGKCLIIRPPMPPDEDEMIKETFYFLKHPNTSPITRMDAKYSVMRRQKQKKKLAPPYSHIG